MTTYRKATSWTARRWEVARGIFHDDVVSSAEDIARMGRIRELRWGRPPRATERLRYGRG